MSETLLDLRLKQIRLEAEWTCSFEFVAVAAPLPPFSAGAHIDLHLPESRIRSYSLVNSPDERHRYVVAVQRESGGRGGSAYMHDSIRVGQVVQASVPANDFMLNEGAEHTIFIVGGIGITPILSMVARLEALNRSWRLYYASRAPDTTAFMETLAAFDRKRGRVEYCFATTRIAPLDVSGIVTRADHGTHVYCCGPARMIDAFIAACKWRPPHTVHFERFAAADAPATEGGYVAVLQRSGKRVPVEPGKTLLDALLEANVSVPYACSSGVCGTCQTKVIAGKPDHRDEFLTPAEKAAGARVMVCCSGSLTPELVLDL